MTADDLARAGVVPAESISVPPRAEQAAVRLRAALEKVGFRVERDFELCRAEAQRDGAGVVGLGRLGLATADRLWRLLDQCGSAGLRAHCSAAADIARRSRRRANRPIPSGVPEEARSAAERLKAGLARVGFNVGRDVERCDPSVTTSGLGLVLLGRLPAATADMLAELLEAFDALQLPAPGEGAPS